jgi:hypothetical protein
MLLAISLVLVKIADVGKVERLTDPPEELTDAFQSCDFPPYGIGCAWPESLL